MANSALAFEESVRRMTPVRAPDDQRQRVVELLHLVRQVTSETGDPAMYKLVGPNGEEIALPESVFLLRIAKRKLRPRASPTLSDSHVALALGPGGEGVRNSVDPMLSG